MRVWLSSRRTLYLDNGFIVGWKRCRAGAGGHAPARGDVARRTSGYNRGRAWDLRRRHARPNSRLATYFLELCLPEKEALGIFAPMFHVNHFGTIGTFREPL